MVNIKEMVGLRHCRMNIIIYVFLVVENNRKTEEKEIFLF